MACQLAKCSDCDLVQGFEPIIASTKGGKVPLDPKSTKGEHLTATSQDFLKDSEDYKLFLQCDQAFADQHVRHYVSIHKARPPACAELEDMLHEVDSGPIISQA